VWNGSAIGARYHELADIAQAVRALVPSSWSDVGLEWLVKAGEGGDWQSTWDPHPLAVSGPARLAELVTEGEQLGVRVVPYVVVRGRAEWLGAELEQVAACARVAQRVVLNLEPGASYFNGTPTLDWVNAYFARLGVDRAKLELCAIPRSIATAYLGGPAVMHAWLASAIRASWECYDAAAPDLSPDRALQLVDQWGAPPGPQYRVPVVQRSRIGAWCDSELAGGGMEVWHLDADV
jgi:hypothetical protein